MKWLLIKIWSNLWLYKYVIQKITVRRSTNCSPQLNEHVCLSNSIQNNYLIYQFKRYQLLVRNLIEHIWDCYLRIEKYVIFIWCTKTPALGVISCFFCLFFLIFTQWKGITKIFIRWTLWSSKGWVLEYSFISPKKKQILKNYMFMYLHTRVLPYVNCNVAQHDNALNDFLNDYSFEQLCSI